MRTLIGYFMVMGERGNYKEFLEDYKKRMKKRYDKDDLREVIEDMEKVIMELKGEWL